MRAEQDYNHSFNEELKKLNPGQRTAVEQIEGPILVIAGPGTGKTQILSARIGKILSETDSQPHNILCLTYTEAGTLAMRKRLLRFIGPDAYRVNIFTFHAFCNQVIQENNDLFGIRGLQPVSELETATFFEQLIDNFPPKHPLKRYGLDPYYEAQRLKSLFSTMKKEGWSADFISEKIDLYLNDLPNREKYIYKRANSKTGVKAGDVKQSAIDEEKEKMEKLRAAAKEFDAFETIMRKAGRYDYDDMIIWVLDAFRANPTLLFNYQERFHYILVDEYQDTNGAQNQIVNLLASYWDNPNIFVVGDDDQSIYRFQGANLANILDFNAAYQQHLKIVLLKENYRSTQAILDVSKTLIEYNHERLTTTLPHLDKNLMAAHPALLQSEISPTLTEYYNILHEELGIINALENLYQQGEPLSEVAVIFRNHKQVENIVKALQKKQIPLNIKRKVNILELPLIQNIVNLLRYIREEFRKPDSREHLLFEIMHYDFFHISHRDINMIARACYGRDTDEPGKNSWRLLMQSKERMFKLGLENSKAISELEDNLAYWIKGLPNYTVQGLFEKILTRGGLLAWLLNEPDRVWLMQVVTTFFDFIKNESARQTNYSLSDLLQTLDQMKYHKIPLEINQSVFAENGINFITAHSSKGLEFQHVFLIGCSSNQWEAKRSPSSNFSFPDTLVESVAENKIEEERRLFYVAMTRAKEYLHISYSGLKDDGKPQEPSRFVAEIQESKLITLQTATLPDEQVLHYQADILLSLAPPSIKLMDEEYMKEALKNYRMSVTHLNKYLSCPIRFYFENVIKVPTARNESLGFGNAVHHALDQLFKKMNESKDKVFPTSDFFLKDFLFGMKIYQSHFTDKEYERRKEYGSEFLPAYYQHYISQWNKNVLTEYAIHQAEFEGVPLTGKLDKIELESGRNVNVIDYKTGKAENGRKKLNPPSEREPNGGDYWRQIIFYKILLDSDRKKNYNMISGEFDFVEPNKDKAFVKEKVVIDPQSVSIVKTQIKDTYDKIMRFEFDKGCGDPNCQWCNFVKYNYPKAPLDLPAEDEE
jgi:DNA helicase-2/ATP-dependent DNA helicase PcrA